MVATSSSTKESTTEIVDWESGQTGSSIFFGSETWEILGTNSCINRLGSWDKDGFTTSGSGSSTDFTDEETHSTEQHHIAVESISRGEEGKGVISVEETVSTTCLRGVDPAFDTCSSTLNDNLNLVRTFRVPEWSHSESEDGNVLLFWLGCSSNMELDTSVDNGSTIVGTFVGLGSIDSS